MKYIITDKNEVVIGSNTMHGFLAEKVRGKVVRAGHCEMNGPICMRVWGSSIGFSIPARADDKDIINRSSVQFVAVPEY